MERSLAIPNLADVRAFYPEHYLQFFFLGNRPADYKVAVLIDAFVRLAEASLHQYESGRRHIETFWNTHDRIAVSALILGSSYFESCLTNVHRAIDHMRQLKGWKDMPSAVKAALPKDLVFIEEDVAKRITDLRNTIQHFDDRVKRGEVPEGTFSALMLTGPVTTNEDGTGPKTVDRLSLGKHELLLQHLAQWLREMAQCSEAISKVRYGSGAN